MKHELYFHIHQEFSTVLDMVGNKILPGTLTYGKIKFSVDVQLV